MIEWFSSLIDKFGDWLFTVLPTSPFQPFINNFHGKFDSGLSWLNWFIPIHDIKIIFLAWLGMVAIFYGYSIILRWIKAL